MAKSITDAGKIPLDLDFEPIPRHRGVHMQLFGLKTVFHVFAAVSLSWVSSTYAGVFDIPMYLDPGKFSVGLEPEVTLSPSSGLGANVKYHHGIGQFLNTIATVGSGGGPRRFRIGGAAVYDFFPDMESQPGIGIAAQGLFVNRPEGTRFEATGIPYLHKSFAHGEQLIDPFIALPVGWGFQSGDKKSLIQFVTGAHFQMNERIRTVFEIGLKIHNTHSYISGGVIFTP